MSQLNEPIEPTLGDSGYQHLRRAPRFKAFEDRVIAVVVDRAPGCEPREVRGRILDLSAGGAKLAVSCEVALQEAIHVRFDLPEVSGETSVAAKVCWARTAGGASWRLGCAFVNELPESLLSQLATHRYIDRRESSRQETLAVASIQWELTRETSEVRIQDLSAGGFNVVCAQPVVSGTRLKLLLGAKQEETAVPAVVRWSRHADEGFVLGCAYLEEGAYRRVEQALAGGGAATAEAVGISRANVAMPSPGTDGDDRPIRPGRLNVDAATRLARRNLWTASLTMVGSCALLPFSGSLGPLGWAATATTMLTAALTTARYHRLTERVLVEAAEAARQGKLR